MKETMTSVDIAAVVAELQPLIGARVEKAYQLGEKEIRLKLYHKDKGTVDLIIEAGKRIHTSKFQRASPKTPSNFAMFLRKHLGGGRISHIVQYDFDRIVEIGIATRDKAVTLIAELLPRGNIIIVDENTKIMLPLKRTSFSSRRIRVGEKYETPPSRTNPLEISESDLKNLCTTAAMETDIVRVLASGLSLGGLYAEEVCYRAGVEKTRNAKEMTEEEIKAIYEALFALFQPIISGEIKANPHIVIEGGSETREKKKVDVLPFELRKYEGKEKICFASFNDAVDEFFIEKILEGIEEKAEEGKREKRGKYERILKTQQEALCNYKLKEEECMKKGELIYVHYKEIEGALNDFFSKAKGGKRKKMTLSLMDIDIDTSSSLHQNAQAYYKRAKVFRKKKEGVEKAIEVTLERIKEEKEKAREKETGTKEELKLIPQKKVEKRRGEWYERFRWFETSDGFLVVGGKDATTNEILVKKYMEDEDLFFHTQAEGAPVVIEVSPLALKEIAQFAASYSNLWKYGFYEGECYCVTGTQVSKTPRSGEYIKKGGFVIRGKRSYFKVPLGLCIGLEKGNPRLIVCPSRESLIKKQKMRCFVELEPGDELEKAEIANTMVKFFNEREKEKERERTGWQEKIMQVLPPGKSKIKQVADR
jgi:predicted ribosome quality control (RQC) complex YloA/Tae2 family protein